MILPEAASVFSVSWGSLFSCKAVVLPEAVSVLSVSLGSLFRCKAMVLPEAMSVFSVSRGLFFAPKPKNGSGKSHKASLRYCWQTQPKITALRLVLKSVIKTAKGQAPAKKAGCASQVNNSENS